MKNSPVCDFCGRPEISGQRELEVDEDGLLVCSECKPRLYSGPEALEEEQDGELDEKLRALAGKSAGAICRTLDLPYVPPYHFVIDAASNIAYDCDRYMSAWLFVTQWLDGTTVWRSEDRRSIAVVAPDGTIHFEPW